MSKTKRILEYIRDNQPCKATDICEAILEKRVLQKCCENGGEYFYYPGWSGFREYLTIKKVSYSSFKEHFEGNEYSKPETYLRYKYTFVRAIKLTKKNGYVLTSYGRTLLKRNQTDKLKWHLPLRYKILSILIKIKQSIVERFI